jgi:Resolvase, N terminal domain
MRFCKSILQKGNFLRGFLQRLVKMKIGYARVSTFDQNLDLQLRALEKAGCKKIFTSRAGVMASKSAFARARFASASV